MKLYTTSSTVPESQNSSIVKREQIPKPTTPTTPVHNSSKHNSLQKNIPTPTQTLPQESPPKQTFFKPD